MPAKAMPPAAHQLFTGRVGRSIAATVAAVVLMVNVAEPALVPLRTTGDVAPKLKVGKSDAPVGLEVTTAVSDTLPVKPPEGVIVMAEVFPVVAPGARVTFVAVRVKAAGVTAVTLTEVVLVALL